MSRWKTPLVLLILTAALPGPSIAQPPGVGRPVPTPPPTPSRQITGQEAIPWLDQAILPSQPNPVLRQARQAIPWALAPAPQAEKALAVFPKERALDASHTAEGRWTPTAAEADAAWNALAAATDSHKLVQSGSGATLQSANEAVRVILPVVPFRLEAYQVQAAGVVATSNNLENPGDSPIHGILLNGLCRQMESPIWRETWFSLQGLFGRCRFQALYDDAQRRVVSFIFLGPELFEETRGWWSPDAQNETLIAGPGQIPPANAFALALGRTPPRVVAANPAPGRPPPAPPPPARPQLPPQRLTVEAALAWIDAQPDSAAKTAARERLIATVQSQAKLNDEAAQRRRDLAVFGADKDVMGLTGPYRWEPSVAEAEQAWDALDAFHTFKAPGAAHVLTVTLGGQVKLVTIPGYTMTLANYHVQAAGIVGKTGLVPGPVTVGRRYIVLNGACISDPDQFRNWKNQWIVVFDGGNCFFKAYYDPETRQIVTVQFNGLA